MGVHVMLALVPGSRQRAMYEEYVTRVKPPVVKFCRQGMDNALLAWTRAQGSKIVGRYVDVALVSSGAENGRLARKVIGELTPFMAHLDYIEFANEEMQGKGDPKQWDILMEACLDFMVQLDAANKAAGRAGPKACIANTSVGQPEIERWSRPATLETARYAAANGHVWGIHEYYKPDPWALVEGGKAAWDGTAPAQGWLMLRCVKAVQLMRHAGINGFRFIITESGRDNVPGQPGPGGGFRDVPGEPYADRMRQYGRHLSAIPECIGWVDFGYNAWEGWQQFDLTLDPPMHASMIEAMLQLPRGGTQPAPTPEQPMPTTDKLAAILTAKLGGKFADVRASLPKHDSQRFGALDPSKYRGITVHHSAGPRDQTPTQIAAYHVGSRGWAGIGYHIVIRHGVAYYCGDIATQRAHVAGRNHELIGVCITGDYTEIAPHSEDAATLKAVVEALDEFLGRKLPVAGHGASALPGHGTECPGAWASVVGAIRTGAAGPGPGDSPMVNYGKVCWALEQSMRILEAEGYRMESSYIKATALADAIKRRDGRA